jgi:hypothetical protein
MRTTITLDDDVAAALRRAAEERRVSWKTVTNEVLRAGLAATARTGRARRVRLRTAPVSLGRPLLSIDDVAAAIAVAEGDGHA